MVTVLSRLALAVGIAGSAFTAADATALIMTYTGTVSSGVDAHGVFGTAGSNMAGQVYTAVYHYDTDAMTASGSDTLQTIYGPASATFTMNGVTTSFTGDGQSLRRTDLVDIPTFTVDLVYGGDFQLRNYVWSASTMYSSVDLTTAFTYVIGPLDATLAYLTMGDVTFDLTEQAVYTGAPDESNAGSAAPEPTTWLMMVGGFGAIGGSIRRRTKVSFAKA